MIGFLVASKVRVLWVLDKMGSLIALLRRFLRWIRVRSEATEHSDPGSPPGPRHSAITVSIGLVNSTHVIQYSAPSPEPEVSRRSFERGGRANRNGHKPRRRKT
jgi:hypothetical protein